MNDFVCKKCDGTSFKIREDTGDNGTVQRYFVYCNKCGNRVGEFNPVNLGLLCQKQAC